MATPMPPQSVPLTPANSPAPEPRKLPAGYGASWWGEGWRVFSAAPGTWIALVVILLVLMFLMLLVPIVGGLAQSLLMPVFGGGVMLGCHALARGEPLRIGHLFDGFGGSGRFGSLVIIGLVMLAASIVLGLICLAVIFATIGIAGLTALASLADPDADQPHHVDVARRVVPARHADRRDRHEPDRDGATGSRPRWSC